MNPSDPTPSSTPTPQPDTGLFDHILVRLFGTNYRTTIAGLFTTASLIAAGIALNPSSVASIPEPYKSYVLAAAGIIFLISSLYKNAQMADAKTLDTVIHQPTPPAPPTDPSQK